MIKAERDLATEGVVHANVEVDTLTDLVMEFAAITAQICKICEGNIVDGVSVQEFVRSAVDIGVAAYEADREAVQDGD